MTPSDKRHTVDIDLEQQALEQQARASLDDSVAHLDAATLSQLNRARQRALAEGRKTFFQRNWLPLGAATCAAIALAVALPLMQVGQPEPATDSYYSNAEDAELVENLDLVLWLMDSEDNAS